MTQWLGIFCSYRDLGLVHSTYTMDCTFCKLTMCLLSIHLVRQIYLLIIYISLHLLSGTSFYYVVQARVELTM